MELPKNYKLLYSAQQIETQIALLGDQITEWRTQLQSQITSDILTIPLLRGGIFFFADLVRTLQFSVDLSPIRASSYISQTNQPAAAMGTDLSTLEVQNRAVLLVDDICDSGRTLSLLTEQLRTLGAEEVRSVTLVKREVPESFEPTWSGFRYCGDEWMVGYGMDDKERWRNLESIYIIA